MIISIFSVLVICCFVLLRKVSRIGFFVLLVSVWVRCSVLFVCTLWCIFDFSVVRRLRILVLSSLFFVRCVVVNVVFDC